MESIIFGIITLALIGGHLLYVREKNRETAKLINSLIAKNAQDAVNLNLSDKVQLPKPQQQQQPDLIPEQQLDQTTWEKAIKQQLEQKEEE